MNPTEPIRPDEPTAPWFVWAMVLGVGAALLYATLPPDPLPPRKRRPRANRTSRRQRRTSRRRPRRNPVSEADKKRASEIVWMDGGKRWKDRKELKKEIRGRFPAPTADEIKKWNRDKGTDQMQVIEAYGKRTGLGSFGNVILQMGWMTTKGELRPNPRGTARNPNPLRIEGPWGRPLLFEVRSQKSNDQRLFVRTLGGDELALDTFTPSDVRWTMSEVISPELHRTDSSPRAKRLLARRRDDLYHVGNLRLRAAGIVSNPRRKTSKKKTSKKAAKKTSRRRRIAPVKAKTEFKMYESVGVIRDLQPRRTNMPPGALSKIKERGAGTYVVGYGTKGQSVRKYKASTDLTGILASARMASKYSGEPHWVVDFHAGYPVVVRQMDDRGRTVYRAEEYATELVERQVEKVLARPQAKTQAQARRR